MIARERIDDVRAYYERILPFYEKESVARAHLQFWRRVVRRYRPDRILEIGAGLGRITTDLGRYAPAVGIDISLEMLRRAVKRLSAPSRVRFVAADMRSIAFEQRFDLIIAPSDPFSHLLSMADRRLALRAAAQQLSENGHLVIEGLYRDRKSFKPAERVMRHETGILSISESWRPLGARELWLAQYRYRDRRRGQFDRTLEASFVARAWDPSKMRHLLASCGLAVEAIWGDFDRRPFHRKDRRLLIVARRQARFLQRQDTGRKK